MRAVLWASVALCLVLPLAATASAAPPYPHAAQIRPVYHETSYEMEVLPAGCPGGRVTVSGVNNGFDYRHTPGLASCGLVEIRPHYGMPILDVILLVRTSYSYGPEASTPGVWVGAHVEAGAADGGVEARHVLADETADALTGAGFAQEQVSLRMHLPVADLAIRFWVNSTDLAGIDPDAPTPFLTPPEPQEDDVPLLSFEVVSIDFFGPYLGPGEGTSTVTREADGKLTTRVEYRTAVPPSFVQADGLRHLWLAVAVGNRLDALEDLTGGSLMSRVEGLEERFVPAWLSSGAVLYRVPYDGPPGPLRIVLTEDGTLAVVDPVGMVMLVSPAAPVAYAYMLARSRRAGGVGVASKTFAGAVIVLAYAGVGAWLYVHRFAPLFQLWPLSTEAAMMSIILAAAALTVLLTSLALRAREVKGLNRAVSAARLTEAELRRRAQDLETLTTDLGGQVEDHKTLTQSVTHDLKAPLLSVNWLSRDLEDELRRLGSTGGQATLARLRDTVGGMERLVTDLMALTHAEAGELRAVPTDTGLLVEEVVAALALHAERRGCAIECRNLPPDDVMADPALLRQAIQNLVHNAIKYGRDHGGHISIHGERRGVEVHVHIDDDGPGIPPAHRERIFGLLQRNPDETRRIEGTGLGLALVRRIVERHGGTVHATESPVGGARFTLRLPALQRHAT